jgi:hypothetical protein|eukprot:COSAG02_NODE_71_length_42019_cov_36.443893_2_plen_79_part_00
MLYIDTALGSFLCSYIVCIDTLVSVDSTVLGVLLLVLLPVAIFRSIVVGGRQCASVCGLMCMLTAAARGDCLCRNVPL